MSKRRGLGKGLQALIPFEENSISSNERLREIDIDKIKNASHQARKFFDQEKLNELAASIKEHGVIQPVVVRPVSGGSYELIAGERRWRACKILGIKKVPAVVKEYKDIEATAISLIENIQREELNPLEEASAYQQLIDDFGLTQEEVSVRIGKSRPFIANMVRLLGLPGEIKEMLAGGQLSAGHARALLAIRNEKKQLAVAEKIVKQQLSVRQAEKVVKTLLEKEKVEGKSKKQKTQYIIQAEKLLEKILGLKVKIKESGGKGKLEIDFIDEAGLKKVVDIISGEKNKNVSRETF